MIECSSLNQGFFLFSTTTATQPVKVNDNNIQSLLKQYGNEKGYTLYQGEINYNAQGLKFKQFTLAQGYDPETFEYINPQDRSAAYRKYDKEYFGNLQAEVDAYQGMVPMKVKVAAAFGEGMVDGAWKEMQGTAKFIGLAVTDKPAAANAVYNQLSDTAYAVSHPIKTVTSAYQSAVGTFNELKQMSPEARATVLGDKTGALAFDALLMKGAGGATKGLATEVKGVLKETAEATSRRLSQSGSSVALTTPEGVRITVKNSPGTEIQKIDFGKTEGAGDAGRYSGTLEKVNKPDAAADALADRIGGQSRVKFSGDSAGREFDAISDQYVAQSKPALQTVNKSVRDQMKATFEVAQETGRKVYYHFEGQPAQSVIDKLNEYSSRYGIDVVIDTKPLK
ncbi:restriction endonuclease fold toxin [Paenibacillus wynnii]|uniref:Tox-REase-3 domain-containing protein n=1 Tax=Paenibacillus wynnii TaxID=268407 RepID=A0A098MDE3_9BACL|nr:restriction endonuclease fold toxin [Paenibacillus wynnii]KGE19582.1 hypothetical protein PWYN_09720 [Paenibacillus wynnii]